jgi:hypothetical protein
MNKGRERNRRYCLGDLIVALFEETKKVSSDRTEQNILVYAALKDLLRRKVQSYHPISIQN